MARYFLDDDTIIDLKFSYMHLIFLIIYNSFHFQLSDILNELIFHIILNSWIQSTINILLIDFQLTFWLFFEYLFFE